MASGRWKEEVVMSFLFFANSVLLGVGLAMDAFSVSLANGIHEPMMRWKKMGRTVTGL